MARGNWGNHKTAAIGGSIECDNRVKGGSGFGIDGEKRLGLPRVDCRRAKSECYGIQLSIKAQVVKFPAVFAPAQTLRSFMGYEKAFSGHAQTVLFPVDCLNINFGLSGFIG